MLQLSSDNDALISICSKLRDEISYIVENDKISFS